jgi:hypothetical protein
MNAFSSKLEKSENDKKASFLNYTYYKVVIKVVEYKLHGRILNCKHDLLYHTRYNV